MFTLRSFRQTWLAISHNSIQVLYFLFYVKLLDLEVYQLICCLPQDFIFGNRYVNIFDLHTKVVVLLIELKYNWQMFLFDISLLAVSKRFL